MNNILSAVLVIVPLGFGLGLLLAVASHFMKVKENEMAKKLRQCLPGINCGACGYTGCDDYANALSEGGVKPNLCVPGADAVATEIASVLGVECEDVEEKIALVSCNGSCEARKSSNDYAGVNTCVAKAQLYGGPDDCKYSCLGSGDCASVCPNNAICLKDGVARIDRNKCVGCGLCADTCPRKIISLVSATKTYSVLCNNKDKGALARKMCTNACIGCKKCELNCPEKAITVENNLAKIDYDKCSSCGLCAENCPTHSIRKI